MSEFPKARIAIGGVITSLGAERLARLLATQTTFALCTYEVWDTDLEAIPADDEPPSVRLAFFEKAILDAIEARQPLGVTLSDPEDYYCENAYPPNDRRCFGDLVDLASRLGLTWRIITPVGSDFVGIEYDSEVSLHGPTAPSYGTVFAGAGGSPVVHLLAHHLEDAEALMGNARRAFDICAWRLPALELVTGAVPAT